MIKTSDIEKMILFIEEKLQSNKGDYKKINMNNIYSQTVELAEKIKIHSDINAKPTELIKRKFPHESNEELEYRLESFQPITPSYWNKAQGTTNRVWSKQNYSITYEEQHREYFTEQFPVYGNIEVFFSSIMSTMKINDPNSVIAIKPYRKFYTEEGKVDQTKEVEPFPYLYTSEKVIDFLEKEYCIVLTEQKSTVTQNKKNVQEGLVFHICDDTYIYEVSQYGKKNDYFFEYELIYEHNLGYLPAWILKGLPIYFENSVLYHSYFMPAISLLNLATINHSTLDAVIAKHAYPIKAYYVDDCNNPDCENGFIKEYSDASPGMVTGQHMCPQCQGSGKDTRFTPLRDYQIGLKDERFQGDQAPVFPGIQFVEPGTNIFDWLYKTVIDYIERGFTFLNIDVSNSKVKGSDTALGKQIDREELQSFLLTYSSEVHGLAKNIIRCIGEMRYNKSFAIQKYSEPHEFSIKNAADLTVEYTEAEKSNLPIYAKQQILNSYVEQRFGNDVVAVKINQIIMLTDPLITFSNEDVLARKSAGLIDAWQVILHDNIYNYIINKLNEDENYLEKNELEIIKELREKAKEDESSLKIETIGSSQNLIVGVPENG